MALKLITPGAAPLTLAEVKAHLRKTTADEDTYIGTLMGAVRSNLEGKDGWLGRPFMAQTWELQLDAFPDDGIKVPLPPLRSVASVKYLDAAGVEQTLSPTLYAVDSVSEPGWVLPSTSGWPAIGLFPNAVRVRFDCGYDVLPDAIKLGMYLTIGHYYENREDTISGTIIAPLPRGAARLFAPLRVMEFR